MSFEVDGNPYTPAYGTIRNYFKEFRQEGKIKKYGKSKPAFYKLMERSQLPHLGTSTSDPELENVVEEQLKK